MRALVIIALGCLATDGWAQPADPPAQPSSAPASAASVPPAAPVSVAPVTQAPAAPVTQAAPATQALAAAAFEPTDVVALVHADNPVKTIKRADLAAMYLGQRKAWAHGPSVRVLRRTPGGAVRALVDERLLDMSSASYRRHWQRKELAGKGIAPRTIGSAAQLLRAVRSDPRAVGCLSGAEAVHLPQSAPVRAIRVEE